MPKNSLKRDSSTGISSEFCAIFQKTCFTEDLQMTALADASVPTKVLFSDHTFSFFPSFYPFIIDNCNYVNLSKNQHKWC